MAVSPHDRLSPRKTPRQARAGATLDAIFEATIQVLRAEGERRLTTTRVAERAGVSVGTLYQYLPNKQALLFAVLRWHLARVAERVDAACRARQGVPLAEAAEVLVTAFLDAKLDRLDVSQALYAIGAELDATALLAEAVERNVATAAALLAHAPDAAFDNLPSVASLLFSTIAGNTRVFFERGATPAMLEELRRELPILCRAYLEASRRPAARNGS